MDVIPYKMIRNLIRNCRWKFASSMARMPHWYTIIGKGVPNELEGDFQVFGRVIKEQGYTRYFWSRPIQYLDVDGWCYWHMGCLESGEYDLINRAKLPNMASEERGKAPSFAGTYEKEEWEEYRSLPVVEAIRDRRSGNVLTSS